MFWEEKTRKPIPMRVKRKIYERVKGKCEKCRISLKMNEGDFHHTRDRQSFQELHAFALFVLSVIGDMITKGQRERRKLFLERK